MFFLGSFKKVILHNIFIILGMSDLGNIWVGAIVTGFLSIKGAVYCSYPNLIYFSGLLGVCKYFLRIFFYL